ncbi:MAG: hypothetical protein FJ388_12335 [Verrucomicrobia bacterium]|nr:hypothetical protein [Verrucomicrobiota bacterium]
MRTTLDLPDELFRQVKAKAALQGSSLKELVMRYVESGLRQSAQSKATGRKRNRLPLIKRRGRSVIANVTPELRAKLEEEEDLAKVR